MSLPTLLNRDYGQSTMAICAASLPFDSQSICETGLSYLPMSVVY